MTGTFAHPASAAIWTWTGRGTNDNWSLPANWTPAGPPHSDYTTTLVFDGTLRLGPVQDLLDAFQFGSLVFSATAGGFQLGGASNAFGQAAWRSLQFAGCSASLSVQGSNNVVIHGALVTPSAASTQTISVASGLTLQVPWILGGQHRQVVKKGGGTLRVYESDAGQRYLQNSCTVGPEYCVEDGTIEMGTCTDRYVLASDGSGWQADPVEVKASYSLTVGNGEGGPTSAVIRLIGPSQQTAQLLDNNLYIMVNADGLLDFNGVQDWCRNSDDPLHLTISNGLVRLGGSSLYVRNGRMLDLRGSARIDGSGPTAIRFYDGATNLVDGLDSCVVVAADAALVRADNVTGVVFQISGHTGDVAALEMTGHLGAGGAGSHLVKRGPGTMAIANLTHALRTNRVEEGTLLIRGLSQCCSSGAGAQWLVASNATLGGAGTISNAAVVVQGGTIDPGDAAAGTLTIAADLQLGTGATLAFDLTPSDRNSDCMADQLVLQNGNLSGLSNATLRLDVQAQANVDGKTFRVISGGGDYTGTAFRMVAVTGVDGRRALVNAGVGYIDVTIQNLQLGTILIIR